MPRASFRLARANSALAIRLGLSAQGVSPHGGAARRHGVSNVRSCVCHGTGLTPARGIVMMEIRDTEFVQYLWALAMRSPVLVVAFIGIVWALLNMKKIGGAANLAIVACSMLILSNCVFPAMYIWLPGAVRDPFMNRLIAVSSSVATAVCFGA